MDIEIHDDPGELDLPGVVRLETGSGDDRDRDGPNRPPRRKDRTHGRSHQGQARRDRPPDGKDSLPLTSNPQPNLGRGKVPVKSL
ncbi:MAG: hypothetical protein M0C28_44930 [Candidatus Moduliflexus flocculans]|nr:hypothetical protein [Candidatus Moduliflexus flocculans]